MAIIIPASTRIVARGDLDGIDPIGSASLVVCNPDGSTEGKHPKDASIDVMREIHEPAPLLRVIRG